MAKLSEKFFDVRTMEAYLKKGVISKADIDQHTKSLPNDEFNFELTILEEDDDVEPQTMSDDEIKSMPPLTEEDIDNFDFLEKKEENH